jgi:splicing factor 1
VHVQIESIQSRLARPDLGIPANPAERSPSPPPMYSTDGKRLNTREVRTRKKLEEERHRLIAQAVEVNPEYKPPADYRPPSSDIRDTVWIPQDEFPDVNFIGLIIGPRGNTLKKIERDTGARIQIRGRGSVKEGRGARPDPENDLPLHAIITAPSHESLKLCVARVQNVIKLGTEVPDDHHELKRLQLRELAALNGTLRDDEQLMRCKNCGSTAHRAWQCTEQKVFTNTATCSLCGGTGHLASDCKNRRGGAGAAAGAPGPADAAAADSEYSALMAELDGRAPPPAARAGPTVVAAVPPPTGSAGGVVVAAVPAGAGPALAGAVPWGAPPGGPAAPLPWEFGGAPPPPAMGYGGFAPPPPMMAGPYGAYPPPPPQYYPPPPQ